MYCANCGVELASSEKSCPLCGLRAYHPDLPEQNGTPLYPRREIPVPQVSSWGKQIILTTLFLLPMVICLLCDLEISGKVVWSGYVIGALLLGYELFILPIWFRRAEPVVFVPCGFAALGLYLLYLSVATGGGWFLSFAFPVTGFVGLVVTAVVALARFVRKGYLYILGGALVALGLFMPLMGFLVNLTFFTPRFAFWSLYPLAGLVALGGMLIFLAICRPARQTMEQKFFL